MKWFNLNSLTYLVNIINEKFKSLTTTVNNTFSEVYENLEELDNTKSESGHTHTVSDITDTLPITSGGTGGTNRATALYNLSRENALMTDADGNESYDLNLYINIGYWYFTGTQGANLINAPEKRASYLIVLQGGGANRKQIWMAQSGSESVHCNIYVRNSNGSTDTWTSWAKITTGNDLANYLALSGGEMTAPISSSVVTDKYLAGNQGIAIINSTATGYVALAKLNSTNGCFTIASHGNKMLVTYTDKATVEAGTNSTTKTLQLITEDGSSKFNDVYSNNKLVVTEGRLSGSTVGENSTAIGNNNTASNSDSTAIGFENTSSGNNSVALGESNVSSGVSSFAAGSKNSATGNYSIALGCDNIADFISVAIGDGNIASNRAFAIGMGLNNNSDSAFVCGRFNKALTANNSFTLSTSGDVFAIGNGYTSSSTITNSNAFRVTYTGVVYSQGAYNTSGADYAEFVKPWFDNNPNAEDRVGYFVTLKDGYLHKANEGDYIIGVTSGNPSVVGNSDEDYYWKYARDEFNRYIYEDVEEEVQTTDDEGNLLYDEDGNPIYEKTGNIIKNGRIKLSNNYDPSLQDSYIERAKRPEWDYVGMRGIIPVRDDGTCEVGGFCKCGADGIATKAETRGFDTYFVIERISDNVVSIEVK